MNSGRDPGAEETPRSLGPEGSGAAIAGEFPLSDKAGREFVGRVCVGPWGLGGTRKSMPAFL